MNLLAFDTSTEVMAIGIAAGGRRFTTTAPGGAAASATLLPGIEALLAQAGLAFGDLDIIAFGRGPGAFTGLRTSCAVAQGLGFGLALPLLAIDSLLVVAEDARLQASVADADAELAVAMDARMDEVYAARYRFEAARWQVVDAPVLMSPATLEAAWRGTAPDVVAGTALAAFGARVSWPPRAERVEREHDRAAALLRLAEAAAARGEAVDAA
ncbi:MAG: tRNA (adenosine(37)-N6)-threonylcarbamoyltransferase complex dimerization subunit type 1 TsaB, partial [Burkholderiales bacterium]|nr:tRNA (adenosine(37)-N6)-threonylcarbamoyltransferase complex dimerization subunit type 1 TsaB [Burkholderiales bacterium]